jgi:Nose resistant-to-fluoxetine protein, N-terminal domain
VLDANGQLPTGVLSGNANSFGDFDECLSIHNEELKIKGKHCYIEMQPHVNTKAPFLRYLGRRIQSFDIMKSKLSDVSELHTFSIEKKIRHKDFFFQSPHIFNRFSSIVYGLCVPSSCQVADVKAIVKHYIDDFTNNTGFHLDIQLDENMCHIARAKFLPFGAKITMLVDSVNCEIYMFKQICFFF